MEDSVRDLGFDFANRAEDVQENFNPVTAKVEHRTTTGELFLQQPQSGIAGGWIEPLKSFDLCQSGHADFTRLDNLLNPFDHRIKAAIISNAELYALAASGVDHPITLLHIHSHRLFAEHMLSCSSVRDRLCGMKMNRSSDVHCIYLVITQQVAPLGVPPLCTKVFGKRRCQF